MTEHLCCIYCSARLDNGATSCASCKSPVARIACTSCRREAAAGTRTCACGALLETPVASGARCPRCSARRASGQLHRRAITETCSVLACGSCGGSMVEPHSWAAIIDGVEAHDERFASVGTSPFAPAPLGELLAMLTCPGCNRELDRVAFAGKSRVSIDVCGVHGIWFDAGELAKVLDLVRAKGAAAALPDERSDLNADERRAKVMRSMGLGESDLRPHLPALRPGSGFNANRLMGRVAFVAGGLEGAVAYQVLCALSSGASSAAQRAFEHSARPAELDLGSSPRRSGFELPSLRCLFCGATHRETDDSCGACNTPIARVVCTACRARIAAGEPKCRCGAPLLPDAHRAQMACPRCQSALEATDLDANTVAHRCPRCLGSFFGIRDWTVVMDRTLTGNPLPLDGFVALPPGRELPRATLDAGAGCPRCRQPMERITFAMRSQVVVDVCAAHGMWLDAGELVALCNFMNKRNQPQPNPEPFR